MFSSKIRFTVLQKLTAGMWLSKDEKKGMWKNSIEFFHIPFCLSLFFNFIIRSLHYLFLSVIFLIFIIFHCHNLFHLNWFKKCLFSHFQPWNCIHDQYYEHDQTCSSYQAGNVSAGCEDWLWIGRFAGGSRWWHWSNLSVWWRGSIAKLQEANCEQQRTDCLRKNMRCWQIDWLRKQGWYRKCRNVKYRR